MGQFENILKNYAIIRGRESGRLKKTPKTQSFGAGKGNYRSKTNEVVFFDTSDWDRVTDLMKAFGMSLNRRELIMLIKRSIKPTLEATQQEANRIEKEAKSKGRIPTGNLADSIGFITGRSKEFVNIQVGPRVKGKWKGFHGHWVEFGTGDRKTNKGVRRGIAKPNPYMKPAFDRSYKQSSTNFKNEVAIYVENKVNQIF
jgi:hypothetical protein